MMIGWAMIVAHAWRLGVLGAPAGVDAPSEPTEDAATEAAEPAPTPPEAEDAVAAAGSEAEPTVEGEVEATTGVEPTANEAEPTANEAEPTANEADEPGAREVTPPPPAAPGTAEGSFGGPPLPPAPAPAPAPGQPRPWRGRLWFDLGLGAVLPAGGQRPGRGRVFSGAADFGFGVRVLPWLGLSTGLSTYVHEVGVDTFLTVDGDLVDEIDLGRLTVFELLGVRGMLPRWKRIEPWAEVNAGVGPYREPFARRATAAGSGRVRLGLDAWLGTTFTLGLDVGYRWTVIEGTTGHAIQPMLRLGLHR